MRGCNAGFPIVGEGSCLHILTIVIVFIDFVPHRARIVMVKRFWSMEMKQGEVVRVCVRVCVHVCVCACVCVECSICSARFENVCLGSSGNGT